MRAAVTLIALSLLIAPACKKKVPETPPDIEVTPIEQPTQSGPTLTVPEHVRQMVENFNRVYFELDSSDLNEESLAALEQNATIMHNHGDLKVRIEGHADERGTTEYNVALGQRRAESVKERLISHGIAPSRITLVSLGEESPLVQGSTESAWSKNRRAEFVITWGGGDAVQSSTDQ